MTPAQDAGAEPEFWIEESDQPGWFVFDKNDEHFPSNSIEEIAGRHFEKVTIDVFEEVGSPALETVLVCSPKTDEARHAVEVIENGSSIGTSPAKPLPMKG